MNTQKTESGDPPNQETEKSKSESGLEQESQRLSAAEERALCSLLASLQLIIDTLQGDGEQTIKARRIIWSCFRGSHIVVLHNELRDLAKELAEGLIAVIAYRAIFQNDADLLLRYILTTSGEFQRADQQVQNSNAAIYPKPCLTAEELNGLADAVEPIESSSIVGDWGLDLKP